MTKTTYRDLASPNCEHREYSRTSAYKVFGRSFVYITCPFCEVRVKAYIWSLAGGGKRCDCGALHDNMGRSHRLTG